jgi:hypothetical protein
MENVIRDSIRSLYRLQGSNIPPLGSEKGFILAWSSKCSAPRSLSQRSDPEPTTWRWLYLGLLPLPNQQTTVMQTTSLMDLIPVIKKKAENVYLNCHTCSKMQSTILSAKIIMANALLAKYLSALPTQRYARTTLPV